MPKCDFSQVASLLKSHFSNIVVFQELSDVTQKETERQLY